MDIKTDEGKIIKQKEEQIAVYKDKTGNVSALSAVCTHMGCIVGWNSKDKTWDCPCHGSRFNTEGKVINGPAVKDLPKKDLNK
jgi:Rieske Fe-S protein